jgi:acyl carrier protein
VQNIWTAPTCHEGAIMKPIFKASDDSEHSSAAAANQQERIIKAESDFAMRTELVWLTVRQGMVMANAGIDESIITMDTNFYDDLNADSLDIIELTLRFEEAFKIDMAEEASLELKTVRDMFNYVKTKLEEKKLKSA